MAKKRQIQVPVCQALDFRPRGAGEQAGGGTGRGAEDLARALEEIKPEIAGGRGSGYAGHTTLLDNGDIDIGNGNPCVRACVARAAR